MEKSKEPFQNVWCSGRFCHRRRGLGEGSLMRMLMDLKDNVFWKLGVMSSWRFPLRGWRIYTFLSAVVSRFLICFHRPLAQTDTILFGIPLPVWLQWDTRGTRKRRPLESVLVDIPQRNQGVAHILSLHVIAVETMSMSYSICVVSSDPDWGCVRGRL